MATANQEKTYDRWGDSPDVPCNPSHNGMVYLNMATAFRAPIVLRGAQLVDVEAAGLSNLIPKEGTEITSIEVGKSSDFGLLSFSTDWQSDRNS